MNIRYLRKARAQLDQIYAYLNSHNPRAAKDFSIRIEKSIARLARFPNSCRQTDVPGVRVLVLTRYPYLVFYRVNEGAQEVEILRIRHSSQNPTSHLD